MARLNPRITIGPYTKELAIKVGRVNGPDKDTYPEFILHLQKHRGTASIDLCPYAVEDGTLKYEIPSCVRGVEFPRGFYTAEVQYCDCVISCFDVVKASSFVLERVDVGDAGCHEADWCEPACEPPKCEPEEEEGACESLVEVVPAKHVYLEE